MFKTENYSLRRLLCVILLVLKISTNNIVQGAVGDRCKTLNGEDAICISLFSCKTIIRAIASGNEKTLKFAEGSHCDSVGKTSLVCCGSHSTFVEEKPKTIETVKEIDKKELLASRQLCGLQSKDDRFDFRNNTQIDEYPWMALLYYKSPSSNQISSRCSGSLINTRYVLTAASCTQPQGLAELIRVRLGEYDTSSNGTDCVENPDYEECTEPPIDFDIEEVIIHEKFNYSRSLKNNIALIRLAKPVRYSDYIRPICLPFEEDTLDKFGKDVIISGWGQIDQHNYTRVNVKKNSKTAIDYSENCTKIFNVPRFTLTDKDVCVIHSDMSGPCGGDAGGPMMAAIKLQWYQLGVVNFGTKSCGKGSFTVGPKIIDYIDWILGKFKP